MALDRYSKIVFTVIAIALAALALGQLVPQPADARVDGMTWAQLSGDPDFQRAVLFVVDQYCRIITPPFIDC